MVATPKAMPVVPMLLADQKSSNNASYPKNDIHLRVNVIFYAFFLHNSKKSSTFAADFKQ